MPMTQDQFMANNAALCPHCGADDISDTDYTWGDDFIVVDQRCDACLSEWQVLATITEYTNLETPED